MPSTRTINALYAPFHTVKAIHRAEFADFIPVPSSNNNINAVHPISKTWLREELIPRERQDVRSHVVAITRNNARFSERFVAAVTTTLANIGSLSARSPTRPNTGSTDNYHSPRHLRLTVVEEVIGPGTLSPPAGGVRGVTRTMSAEIPRRLQLDSRSYVPRRLTVNSIANSARDRELSERFEQEARVARRVQRQIRLRRDASSLRLIPLFRALPVQPESGDCVLQGNNEVLRFGPHGHWYRYLQSYNPHRSGGGIYLVEGA
jgi:hypothetical protein